MAERHSVEFKTCSFNVLSDEDRGTITLQYDRWGSGGGRSRKGFPRFFQAVVEECRGGFDRQNPGMSRVLQALRGEYGDGLICRFKRWSTGAPGPFELPSASVPHRENPDVLCFQIRVVAEERMEASLERLLDFFSRQPEYQRTFGSQLDGGEASSEQPDTRDHPLYDNEVDLPDESRTARKKLGMDDTSAAADRVLRSILVRRKPR